MKFAIALLLTATALFAEDPPKPAPEPILVDADLRAKYWQATAELETAKAEYNRATAAAAAAIDEAFAWCAAHGFPAPNTAVMADQRPHTKTPGQPLCSTSTKTPSQPGPQLPPTPAPTPVVSPTPAPPPNPNTPTENPKP